MEFDDDCHQGPAESGPEIQLVLSGSLQSDALWMSSVDCNGIAKNSENVRYLVCRRDECVWALDRGNLPSWRQLFDARN